MKASETLCAPAKLNLTLEVLPRRDDRLHGLRSVMVLIDVFDELTLAPHDGFAFSCDVPELRDGNLAERAVRALPLENMDFSLSLEKRIPTGAGMGGGSSDAAAMLLAASRGELGAVGEIDYLALARSLGSDVPFFLTQTAALVEGTGERVTALGAVPPWHAVVIKPAVSISTARAYEQIDALDCSTRPRNTSVSLQMAQALQRADFGAVLSLMQNDFHDAIVPDSPEISAAVDILKRAGARSAMLTGSGSCVFALAETPDERDALGTACQGEAAKHSAVIYTCSLITGDPWRSAA